MFAGRSKQNIRVTAHSFLAYKASARKEEIMSSRTIFLSRLIGLSCLLFVPAMIIYRQSTLDSLAGIIHNPSLILILGLFTLVIGLAMVLAHNIWSGGTLAVVVTLVGWIALLKGLLFLYILPDVGAECLLKTLQHLQLFYVCMIPSLLIGIYLTYGGFTAKSHS
jgi:vacuolar-type H+-ATPase subunit I/STV1